MAHPTPDTVFSRTEKGTEEIRSRTVKLPREVGLVFLSVDGKASVAELLPRSGMDAAQFYRTLEMLVADGYIEAAATHPSASAAADVEGAPPSPQLATFDLDLGGPYSRFPPGASTRVMPAVSDEDIAARARELKARVEAERRAREESQRTVRDVPQLDLPIASEGATHAPESRSMPDPHRDTHGDLHAPPEADPGRAAFVQREVDASATAGATSSVKVLRPHAGAATPPPTATPTRADPTSSGAFRIEGDRRRRESLHADRTAYDVLAEAADARRIPENAVHAQARAAHVNDDTPRTISDSRRKRRVLGVVAVVLFAAVPLLGTLWLQFMPLTHYIPEVEQALSAHVNQPVRLQSVRYVLLPTPRIVLQGVGIGPRSAVRADRIEAHASPFALLTQPRQFGTIEVRNAVIAPAVLASLPSWRGNGPGASDVRVLIVHLSNLRIDIPGAGIAPFNGDISFEPDGSVARAVLANDNLKIRLSPGPNGAALKLDATAWRIPFGPPVKFSYFNATGRLTEHDFTIDEATGRVAGGDLQANGTLTWPGPLVTNGTFSVQNLRLEELLPALTPHVSAKGVLEANGRYEMRAESADMLLESTRLTAEFRVSRGEFENLDLLRGFNAPGASTSRGGRTLFDKLTGTLQLSPAGYQYRQVRLSSGPFNAYGGFEIARDGKLSGRVNAELVVGTHLAARSSFDVGGSVSEPVLRR